MQVRRRKRASKIASHVGKFWARVDKLVIYKHKSRLDAMRRMAMDKHLNFLVGQTERYTSMLALNINSGTAAASGPGADGGGGSATSSAESSAAAIEDGTVGARSASSSSSAAVVAKKRGRPSDDDDDSNPAAGAGTASSTHAAGQPSNPSTAAPADTVAGTTHKRSKQSSSSAGGGVSESKGDDSVVDGDAVDHDADAPSTAALLADDAAGDDGGAMEEGEDEDEGSQASSFEDDEQEAADDEETIEAEEREMQRRRALRAARRQRMSGGAGAGAADDEDDAGADDDDAAGAEDDDADDEETALQREADMPMEELRKLYGLDRMGDADSDHDDDDGDGSQGDASSGDENEEEQNAGDDNADAGQQTSSSTALLLKEPEPSAGAGAGAGKSRTKRSTVPRPAAASSSGGGAGADAASSSSALSAAAATGAMAASPSTDLAITSDVNDGAEAADADEDEEGDGASSFEMDDEEAEAADDEETIEAEEREMQRRKAARAARRRLASGEGAGAGAGAGASSSSAGMLLEDGDDGDAAADDDDIDGNEAEDEDEETALQREADMSIEELRKLYGLDRMEEEGEGSGDDSGSSDDGSADDGEQPSSSTALLLEQPEQLSSSSSEAAAEEAPSGRPKRKAAAAASASWSKHAEKAAASESGADGSEATSTAAVPAPSATAASSPTSALPASASTAAPAQAPEQHTIPTPFLMRNGHLLRPYQRDGLDWLVSMHDRRLNGILADEMGLGKTIQTISLLAHLASSRCVWGPHLIVVPTSTMLNWEMEFKRWCPAFKVVTYYGGVKERKLKRTGWTKPNAFHICITSYQMVLQDASIFKRKHWYYLILDEAHYIKNYQSQRWQTLLTFSSRRRLLLTGTPLQNSLMELWSLMHFLMPHLFRSQAEFKTWFANPLTHHVEGVALVDRLLVQRLHAVLRPFVLRRLKSEVATQMPKKYEHVVMCRLSTRQRYLYEDFLSRSSTRATLQSGNFMSMMNVLMQLRKVCNHPDLFEARPILSPFELPTIELKIPSAVLDPRLQSFGTGLAAGSGLLMHGACYGAAYAGRQCGSIDVDAVTAAVIAAGGDESVLFGLLDAQNADLIGHYAIASGDARSMMMAQGGSPLHGTPASLQITSFPASGGGVIGTKGKPWQYTSVLSPRIIVEDLALPSSAMSSSSAGITVSPSLGRSTKPFDVYSFHRDFVANGSAVRSGASWKASTAFSGRTITIQRSSHTLNVGGLSYPRPGSAAELFTAPATSHSSASASLASTASSDALLHLERLAEDQFSIAFASGVTSLPCVGPRLGVCDLELRSALSSWQAQEVASLAATVSVSMTSEKSLSAIHTAREADYQLPADLAEAVDALLQRAHKNELKRRKNDSNSSITLSPSSMANAQSTFVSEADDSITTSDLLVGDTLRFSHSLVLLHAALRARRRAEVADRLATISAINDLRCGSLGSTSFHAEARGTTDSRYPSSASASVCAPGSVPIYGSDLRQCVSINMVGGWSVRHPAWSPVCDDVEDAGGWAFDAATGANTADAAFDAEQLDDGDATMLLQGSGVAAGSPPGSELFVSGGGMRKSPDQLFNSPFAADEGQFSSSILRGGMVAPTALARPDEILMIADGPGAAPSAVQSCKEWSQSFYGGSGAHSCYDVMAVPAGGDAASVKNRKRARDAAALKREIPSTGSRGSAGVGAAITPGAWASYSSTLRGMVQSFSQRYDSILPTLERFVFLIPHARAAPQRLLSSTSSRAAPAVERTVEAAAVVARTEVSKTHEANVRTQLSFPDRRLVQFDCGKLQALDTLLRERKAGGHRVLIFTQMTRMLDVLETFLNLHDHTYLRLDGATKVDERQSLMDRFNRDPRVFVFILSTRSGGLGINLVGADTVIFYDSDWNPAMDAQAQDRAHRIGQTRDVHIYRLITESTVEENILLKAKQKRHLQQISMEEGNFTKDNIFQGSSLRDIIGSDSVPEGISAKFLSALSGGDDQAAAAGGAAGACGKPAMSQSDLMKAIAAAEDTEDVAASKAAAAEEKQELAEFDEAAQVGEGASATGAGAAGVGAAGVGATAAASGAAADNLDDDVEMGGAGAGAGSKSASKSTKGKAASNFAKKQKAKKKSRIASSDESEDQDADSDDGAISLDGDADDSDAEADSDVGAAAAAGADDGSDGEAEGSEDEGDASSDDNAEEDGSDGSDASTTNEEDDEEELDDADDDANTVEVGAGAGAGAGKKSQSGKQMQQQKKTVRFAKSTKGSGKGNAKADADDDSDADDDDRKPQRKGKSKAASKADSASASTKPPKTKTKASAKKNKQAELDKAASAKEKIEAKSSLDIDLDALQRQTFAEEEDDGAGNGDAAASSAAAASGDVDMVSGSSAAIIPAVADAALEKLKASGKTGAIGVFDAVLSTGGQSAAEAAAAAAALQAQRTQRDRVAIALAKFAELESRLRPAERYALRYRESRDPHPWVEPAVLKSVEESFHSEEREWELEQVRAIEEEEESKANADAELLQLQDAAMMGPSSTTGATAASASAAMTAFQAGERIYSNTLRELRRGIRYRSVTGAAWEIRTDELSKALFYYNTDSRDASWEKPLVLRQRDARHLTAQQGYSGIYRLSAVALNIMRMVEPAERCTTVARVCKGWAAAAAHPMLFKFVKQPIHAHVGDAQPAPGSGAAFKEDLAVSSQKAKSSVSLAELPRKERQKLEFESRTFDSLELAVAASHRGDTIVVAFGSHYVPRSLYVDKAIRIVSQGVRGCLYAGFESADEEWIAGPCAAPSSTAVGQHAQPASLNPAAGTGGFDWYPNLSFTPPSVAKRLGMQTAYLTDQGFASLGVGISSEMAVADSAIIRIDGPLVWRVRAPMALPSAAPSSTTASTSKAPSSSAAASAAGLITDVTSQTLHFQPGSSPISFAQPRHGGGQIQGVTIRNVRQATPHCLVVQGPGAIAAVVEDVNVGLPSAAAIDATADGVEATDSATAAEPMDIAGDQIMVSADEADASAAPSAPATATQRQVIRSSTTGVSHSTTVSMPLPLTVVQCDLGNRSGAGACVAVFNGGAVCLVASRVSAGTGSGILVDDGSTAIVTHCQIQDCGAAGVNIRSGSVALSHSRITACGGPAVRLYQLPLRLPDAMITQQVRQCNSSEDDDAEGHVSTTTEAVTDAAIITSTEAQRLLSAVRPASIATSTSALRYTLRALPPTAFVLKCDLRGNGGGSWDVPASAWDLKAAGTAPAASKASFAPSSKIGTAGCVYAHSNYIDQGTVPAIVHRSKSIAIHHAIDFRAADYDERSTSDDEAQRSSPGAQRSLAKRPRASAALTTASGSTGSGGGSVLVPGGLAHVAHIIIDAGDYCSNSTAALGVASNEIEVATATAAAVKMQLAPNAELAPSRLRSVAAAAATGGAGAHSLSNLLVPVTSASAARSAAPAGAAVSDVDAGDALHSAYAHRIRRRVYVHVADDGSQVYLITASKRRPMIPDPFHPTATAAATLSGTVAASSTSTASSSSSVAAGSGAADAPLGQHELEITEVSELPPGPLSTSANTYYYRAVAAASGTTVLSVDGAVLGEDAAEGTPSAGVIIAGPAGEADAAADGRVPASHSTGMHRTRASELVPIIGQYILDLQAAHLQSQRKPTAQPAASSSSSSAVGMPAMLHPHRRVFLVVHSSELGGLAAATAHREPSSYHKAMQFDLKASALWDAAVDTYRAKLHAERQEAAAVAAAAAATQSLLRPAAPITAPTAVPSSLATTTATTIPAARAHTTKSSAGHSVRGHAPASGSGHPAFQEMEEQDAAATADFKVEAAAAAKKPVGRPAKAKAMAALDTTAAPAGAAWAPLAPASTPAPVNAAASSAAPSEAPAKKGVAPQQQPQHTAAATAAASAGASGLPSPLSYKPPGPPAVIAGADTSPTSGVVRRLKVKLGKKATAAVESDRAFGAPAASGAAAGVATLGSMDVDDDGDGGGGKQDQVDADVVDIDDGDDDGHSSVAAPPAPAFSAALPLPAPAHASVASSTATARSISASAAAASTASNSSSAKPSIVTAGIPLVKIMRPASATNALNAASASASSAASGSFGRNANSLAGAAAAGGSSTPTSRGTPTHSARSSTKASETAASVTSAVMPATMMMPNVMMMHQQMQLQQQMQMMGISPTNVNGVSPSLGMPGLPATAASAATAAGGAVLQQSQPGQAQAAAHMQVFAAMQLQQQIQMQQYVLAQQQAALMNRAAAAGVGFTGVPMAMPQPIAAFSPIRLTGNANAVAAPIPLVAASAAGSTSVPASPARFTTAAPSSSAGIPPPQ